MFTRGYNRKPLFLMGLSGPLMGHVIESSPIVLIMPRIALNLLSEDRVFVCGIAIQPLL